MTTRLIETPDDVAEGARWLAAAEPRFARALRLTGPLPLRRQEGGFGALLRTICAQQVSVESARSVWNRLEVADAVTEARVLALDEAALRDCGLTRQKAAYVHALAGSGLDYDALALLAEDEAVARLTAIKGIGRWTAQIYLMFSVGRADVFAPGDLAIQEAARLIFEMPGRPAEPALDEMARAWSPWRAVAARLFWAYYALAKSREGILE